VRGKTGDERGWSVSVAGQRRDAPAITAQWARTHLRDLEDRYTCAADWAASQELEERIVATSLRFGVLCRFTAYVAIDSRVVAEGGRQHRVLQPVEAPSGWDLLAAKPMLASHDAGVDYLLGDEPEGVECAPIGFGTPMQPAPRARLARADLDGGKEDRDGEKWCADLRPERRIRSRVLRDYLDDTVAAPAADVKRQQAQLAAARTQIREETRRLREAGARTDDQRRELLADLVRRLTVLIAELIAQDVPSSAVSELTAVVAAIEAGGAADPMWDAVLEALDDFAGATGSPDRKRRAFWKRS
jgi:Ca-activated chloride channel family protein